MSSTISPRQYAWLTSQVDHWHQDGLVDASTAEAITRRYVVSRRSAAVSILLWLGAIFVGIGLIWLVASNLDQLSPLSRFVLVTTIWAGVVALAEVVRARAGEAISTAALQLVVVVGLGAVIFQAAQSLHVPAYSPGLVGWWAVGGLLYGYLNRAPGAIPVAAFLSVGWYAWECGRHSGSAFGVALSLLIGGLLAIGIAVAHESLWWRAMSRPWRAAGVILSVIGLFVAAIPMSGEGGYRVWWPAIVVAAVVLGGVFAVGAVAAGRPHQLELAVAAGIAVTGGALAAWHVQVPMIDFSRAHQSPTVQMWGAAIASVLVFILATTWFVYVGAQEEQPEVMFAAYLGLVVFVTWQSFAIFAPYLSGAALFLVVGTIMLATGYFGERGRRHIAGAADSPDDPPSLTPPGAPAALKENGAQS